METINFPIMTAHDIECRPNKVTATGVNLLLYKNARIDMRILDNFVGLYGWQREHKELKSVIYCGVSLRDPKTGEWLTKWDAGKESKQEAEKGEASDSFKRACVNWGIGRELYTAPTIWVDLKQGETYAEGKSVYLSYDVKFSVSEIEYTDNREISLLVIVDQTGAERYRWENGKKKTTRKPTPQPKPAPVANITFAEMSVADAMAAIDAAINKDALKKIMKVMQAENADLYNIVYNHAMNRYNLMNK